MSAPTYADWARRLLTWGSSESGEPLLDPAERARAIAAIAEAITARGRRRRAVRAAGAVAAFAAVVGGVFAGVHVGHRWLAVLARSSMSNRTTEIVAHPSAGGASILVSGSQAPLVEGRALASGSRIVTPPNGRAMLSFSTGTSVSLGEGADLTVEGDAGSEVLELAGGFVDLHVAKLAAGHRFFVRTPDAEVEVRGTQFRVALAAADPTCGGGTRTRVTVSEGVVVVRHDGTESRVPAGDEWPEACGQGLLPAPLDATRARPGHAPTAKPGAGPHGAPVSALAGQNDLYAQAMASKQRGDTANAVGAFDRLLATYPACPLAESASVERMRLLRGTSRALAAAQQYLARYPAGFARPEAETLLGTP